MIQTVLVFIALLLCTLAIRISEETWYSPFSFFALLWTFIIGFSIFTAPEYFFSARALGFISLNVCVFYAGGFVTERTFRRMPVAMSNAPNASLKFLKAHFYVSILAGFASLYFLLHDAGVNFTELFSQTRLMEISKVFTDSRYAGERLSSVTMLCLMIAYSGCLTAGRLFIFSRSIPGKLKTFFVLLPVLVFTIIYTARAVFIFAVLLFIASLLSHYILLNKKHKLFFSKRTIGFMLGGILIIPMVFLFTQAARMGISKFSVDSFGAIVEHLKVYFSGNVSAFSFWFEDHQAEPLRYGALTLAGLNEWLGGSARDLGIYNKAIDVNGHMQFSNVYTLFRFLIDDFGIPGTILIWFGLGIFCRWVYVRILQGDFISTAIHAGLFAWLLFSFITSIFAYNTVLFAWMIFVLITYSSEKLVADGK
jgi:oligosaccharide repeat unit polymerase